MGKEEYREIFEAFGWKEKPFQHKDVLRFYRCGDSAAVYFPSGSVIFTDRLDRPNTLREPDRKALVYKLNTIKYGN